MKSKTVFLWLGVLALLGGLVFLYASNRQKDAALTALRGELDEAQRQRAELEQTNAAVVEAQNEEIARLRNDNQELLRLRNEIRQVREEKQQLARQAQTAQAEVQRAQAQVLAARSEVQALRTNVPSTAPVLAPAPPPAALAQNARALALACINNLRQLDAAKQQWALENRKTPNTVPTAQDLAPYLKDGVVPACPAGGTYTLNAVSAAPTCSIPGHALP
jgi:DNA repair exonuclease SbcCD ATPase subunit